MLSQNPPTIQQRQQHRRQQSTTQVFDPESIISLQNSARRQNPSHRRGISLDVRQRRRSPTTDYFQATNTNQGFRHNQQHILRETQQQRLFRPGHPHQQQNIRHHQSHPQLPFNEDEAFATPLHIQQGQFFDTRYGLNTYMVQENQPYPRFSGPVNPSIQVDSHYNPFEANDLPFSTDGLSPFSAQFDFSAGIEGLSNQQDWDATVKPNRSRSRGPVNANIAERVAQFGGSAILPPQRPITPETQSSTGRLPPTPHSAPYDSVRVSRPMPQRFTGDYDESLEETIKPMKHNLKTQDVFAEMRAQAESQRPLSPPATAPLPSRARFDSVTFPSSAKFPGSISVKVDPMQQSFQHSDPEPTPASPQLSQSAFYDESFDDETIAPSRKFEPLPGTEPVTDNQRRRSESVESINLDDAMTDTGITIDDIAMYISSPSSDSAEQKWTCLFSGCSKKFGRKENIKSHVQTHLGDRQYQCPHCKKCFVRQHDLKRHAKIHSGIKPYPCACGNSFARHDALTRHRQRGMCIGAFDGIVKKTVKRGRPRKARPDDEDRLSKSSRTRSKVAASNASSSEYSESSYGGSPSNDLDDILDPRPFADFDTTPYPQTQASGMEYQSQYIVPSTPLQDYATLEDQLNGYVSPAQIQGEFQLPIMPNQNQTHYRSNSIISMPSSVTQYTSSPSRSMYSPAQEPLTDTSSSPRPTIPSSQVVPLYTVGLEQLSMTNGTDDTDLFLEQFGLEHEAMMKYEEDGFEVQGLGVLDNGMNMDMFGNMSNGNHDGFPFGS